MTNGFEPINFVDSCVVLPVHPAFIGEPRRFERATASITPHDLLVQALILSKRFVQDQSSEKGQYFLDELEDFRGFAQFVPGYLGVMATGYPYYAMREDSSVVPIPEIERFLDQTSDIVEADRAMRAGGWLCTACEVVNDLPDLKTACKPCGRVELKPRDVFKALPDLDFWVIVEDDSPVVEAEMQDLAKVAGFYQSDININAAIIETLDVLSCFPGGIRTESRLPVDMHVVTRAQLLSCLGQVGTALETQGTVPINPRSLHVKWERPDEPYDFLKDLMLSLTTFDLKDPEIQQALTSAKRLIAATMGVGGVLAYMKINHPKEDRQLASEELTQVLATRLDSWMAEPSVI